MVIKVPALKGAKCVCVSVCMCFPLKKKVLKQINKHAHTTAINNYLAVPKPSTLLRHLKIKWLSHFVRLCLILL